MLIIMYDGSKLECREIEFSNKSNAIIVDGWRVIPTIEILRVIPAIRRKDS